MAAFLTKKRIITLSSLIFITLTAIVFLLCKVAIERHESWVEKQVNTTGKLASKEILNIFRNDIDKLENLKHRIEFTNGMYFQNWENDAELLIQQNPSFKFLEWIDSSMVIQKINPKIGNEEAIGLDIKSVGYREAEWVAHSIDNSTNLTDWVELTQGGHSFLVDVPVYYDNRFQGTISAGMDFTSNFNKFANNLENYAIRISDNNESVFFNSKKNIDHNNSTVYRSELLIDSLDGQKWKIAVIPSKELLYHERSSFINYGLIGGVFIALAISMLTYFYLIAKKESKNAKAYNEKLIETNTVLEAERERAEKASRAKTDFLSNMSHEIRTPLHAILGFSQLLENKDEDPSKSKSYIELLNRASSNLLGIVDDILEIDKIESGNIKLEETSFVPSKAVKNLVETFSHQFYEKKLSLQYSEINSSNTSVKGDINKLNQILNNVLKNALKFTQKGGVKVSYDEKILGEHLKTLITIEDSGIGISKERIESIFERFTQIDDGLSKQHQGSGLGLAISKEFASLLGGSINVESTINEGSKFTISAIFKIQNTNQVEQNEQLEVSFPNLSALIVDDNQVNVVVLKKLLKDIDIDVDVAKDGVEAVNKSKTGNYDLIFMDIHMPKMDGFEATIQIRKLLKDVLIFGLSANVTVEAVDKALKSGMDNYITKPFKKERLYKLLQNYFSSNKSKQ